MPPDTTRYDHDFYTWTQAQAALLREGAVDELDLTHLAEEIESLGKRDRRALARHLKTLVLHLLKWHYQPGLPSPQHSWRSRILNARHNIAELLEDSPSLRRDLPGLLVRQYPTARLLAHTETHLPLSTFPETCPWTPDWVLDTDFWAEGTPV